MPYTPPSHRSPATSKPSSPIISRSHSYANDRPSTSLLNAAQRPGFSRSYSYSQKHRRSPSISDSGVHDVGKATAEGTAANASMTNGIAHGSIVHGGSGSKGLGAMSPPESSHSSDEEDRSRSRKLAELQSALHNSMDLKPERRHSPNREEEDSKPAAPRPTPAVSLGSTSPALTPEARKIAHSRSSSEINLSKLKTLNDSPIDVSDGTESDDDGLRIKPPLLRKKSGELVKPALRPASRRRPSSMPGTPTYSKAVHFNEDIVQVRHFLQVDRPIAVSAGSSPVDTYESESEYPFTEVRPKGRDMELEIKLSDFPEESFERKTMPVRIERIFLSPDKKTLIGEVVVQNLAFHKSVTARFTLDYWKTTSEVQAEYNNDVRRKHANDGTDRFNFNIKLSDQTHLETKTLLLCVRYNVNGQEFWDNNNSRNYQVDFSKKAKSRNAKEGTHSFGAGTLGAIPRSRSQQSPQRQVRTTPASPDDFDDFSHRFDSSYNFLQKSANRSIPSNRGRNPNLVPDQPRSRGNATGQGLSNRYDFAASLSAALGTAQSTMSDRVDPKPASVGGSARSVPKPGDKTTPAAISSEKPDLQSAEYNELIQKYCFFGSDKSPGKGSPSMKAPAKPAPNVDGTISESSSENNSAPNSGSNSPSPNSMSPLVDGADDARSSRNVTTFLSRSASPGPVTGFTPRSTSPGAFPHPYGHQTIHGGLDYHHPPAILG